MDESQMQSVILDRSIILRSLRSNKCLLRSFRSFCCALAQNLNLDPQLILECFLKKGREQEEREQALLASERFHQMKQLVFYILHIDANA